MKALKDLMAGNGAHIENSKKPGEPPLPASNLIGNRALGWQPNADGTFRPLGTSIGFLLRPRGQDLDNIALNATNAFDAAQRRYPTSLPPGTSATTTFSSLWSEKLIHPTYLERGQQDGRHDVVIKMNGRTMRLVPIHIDHFIGTLDDEEVPEGDDNAALLGDKE